jgi:hypothetical protein
VVTELSFQLSGVYPRKPRKGLQEAKAACAKEIDTLKEAHEAGLSKVLKDLDGWREQVSKLHEELMSVRTELVNARTENENMYHSHLVPIQVCLRSVACSPISCCDKSECILCTEIEAAIYL